VSVRWVDHTSELELEVEAPSAEAVFADALEALSALISREPAGPAGSRELRLEAPDRAALLACWLDELVFLAESEGFVADGVSSLELGERELVATVHGHRDNPAPLVKGVTYHGLELERRGDGWHGRVVLDV
jgi:SHS2 domain-containing protein